MLAADEHAVLRPCHVPSVMLGHCRASKHICHPCWAASNDLRIAKPALQNCGGRRDAWPSAWCPTLCLYSTMFQMGVKAAYRDANNSARKKTSLKSTHFNYIY